jgi:hypothetical protein
MDRVPDPTLDEIRRACEELQADWTPEEENWRRAGAYRRIPAMASLLPHSHDAGADEEAHSHSKVDRKNARSRNYWRKLSATRRKAINKRRTEKRKQQRLANSS